MKLKMQSKLKAAFVLLNKKNGIKLVLTTRQTLTYERNDALMK